MQILETGDQPKLDAKFSMQRRPVRCTCHCERKMALSTSRME